MGEKKTTTRAERAAANGEAVIVNGGIHLKTSSVNCAAQYPAPGCSDHHPVTKHMHIHTTREEKTRTHTRAPMDACTEPLDHWGSERERNHTSTEKKKQWKDGEEEKGSWRGGQEEVDRRIYTRRGEDRTKEVEEEEPEW